MKGCSTSLSVISLPLSSLQTTSSALVFIRFLMNRSRCFWFMQDDACTCVSTCQSSASRDTSQQVPVCHSITRARCRRATQYALKYHHTEKTQETEDRLIIPPPITTSFHSFVSPIPCFSSAPPIKTADSARLKCQPFCDTLMSNRLNSTRTNFYTVYFENQKTCLIQKNVSSLTPNIKKILLISFTNRTWPTWGKIFVHYGN